MAFVVSPRIGLGTSRLGADGSRADAYALLDAFVDHGGTLIDTAAIYSDWIPGERGRSETVIGEWLAARGSRNKVKLSTKGAHPPIGDMSVGRCDPASLRADVEQSLRRLRTDHIDLYLLHRDDPKVPVTDIFGTLGEFVKEGKIGAAGVSNWDVSRIAQARMLADGPVANQLLGNILCATMNAPEDTTIRVLNRDYFRQAGSEDLTLMLFSSQCRGAFLPTKLGSSIPKDYDNPACRSAITQIAALASDTGIAAGNMVLAFLLQMSPRIIPLIGPHSASQMRDSIKALDVTLDAATLERLKTISGWDGFAA
jgi:aryl-alcohol dehydrogenase-like predicted oxidoreductase